MTVKSLESIRKQIIVEVPCKQAFEVFTGQMGAWWNSAYHIGGEPFAEIVIEPHEGGAWYEVDESGTRCDWGRVLVWDPPRRVLLNWQISARWMHDPDQVTELDLRFTPLSDSTTLVELEHRKLENLGEAAAGIRVQLDDPSGWQGLLDRFALRCALR
jgi:Activator of Hsp90 ATPase homolog 1-like protein